MIPVFVDTNVLLSFVTDRDATQQAQASALFVAAADGEVRVLLHQQVLTEMVYVLRAVYERPDGEVAAVLGSVLTIPGAEAIDELPWVRLLRLWPGSVPDFADAVLAAIALGSRDARVATFDGPLRRRLVRLGVKSYWAE